ncbi:hypothetical protein D8S78_03840 [Natrialba swarupiae]|nr:hypothetical protein [Natrialba swarupiae]
MIAAGPAGENLVRYACLVHRGRDREGCRPRRQRSRPRFEERQGRRDPGRLVRTQRRGRIGVSRTHGEPNGPADGRNPDAHRLRYERSRQPDQRDGETRDAKQPVRTGRRRVRGGGKRRDPGGRVRQRGHDLRQLCGPLWKTRHRPIRGITEAKIPEFESLFATATMQEVDDIKRVMKANDLCDRLGMDTISWGVTVAFARECAENGLLESDSRTSSSATPTDWSNSPAGQRPARESATNSPRARFGSRRHSRTDQSGTFTARRVSSSRLTRRAGSKG